VCNRTGSANWVSASFVAAPDSVVFSDTFLRPVQSLFHHALAEMGNSNSNVSAINRFTGRNLMMKKGADCPVSKH
jgi:hypothetical protein